MGEEKRKGSMRSDDTVVLVQNCQILLGGGDFVPGR